jgi:hypothetical protein
MWVKMKKMILKRSKKYVFKNSVSLLLIANLSFWFNKDYFLDWFLLRIPPHLHRCLKNVPLSKMSYLVDNLFEEAAMFFLDWEHWQGEVIAALELVSIASFAKAEMDGDFWNEATGRIRNWKFFTETAARLSLATLASTDVIRSRQRFMQSVSSIEVRFESLLLFTVFSTLLFTF